MSNAHSHREEHRQLEALPRLGARGGGWVAAQIVLIAAIILSALTSLGWPEAIEPFAYALGSTLLATGVTLLVAGGVGLGSALTPFPAPLPGGELQTGGVYGLVRHPMYGGGILVGLGWSIIFATIAGFTLTVLLTLFALLKAHREEIWLAQQYPDYDNYRECIPHRFIPFLW